MKHFKLLFAAILAVCMTSCDSCSGEEDPEVSGYIKCDVTTFYSMIEIEKKNGLTPQIVDVRTASEYNQGHIPGAINIDGTNPADWKTNNDKFMTTLTSTFSQTQKIFIYGKSGWSETGIVLPGRIAKIWGREKTYNLESGFSGWESANYEMEK